MLRKQFINRLRKLEDIPVPEGHLRSNKGVTTYFFSETKRQEVEALLASQGLTDHGQVKGYVVETKLWCIDTEEPKRHRIFLHAIEPGWISVAILSWPA